MSDRGMTVECDGKKNTILCQGIVKEYPIGGMICEYARLRPTDLKKIFNSYPDKNSERTTKNMMTALEWLIHRMKKEYDPVIALMCLTECVSSMLDLVKATPEDLKWLLDTANENVENDKMKQYILKDTGDTKFQIDTIGGMLSYCYYLVSFNYVIFKHVFSTLMRYEEESGCETESHKKDKKVVDSIFDFYSSDMISMQHIDFKILLIEGKFCSVYTIESSLSLLLFELAHILDDDTESIKIQKCKNCGNYFIVNGRSDSKYCDYPSPQNQNKSCKAIGAQIAMSEKLKNDEATHLYRKIYMRNKMLQKRHPNDKKYPAVLKQLVTEAKRWRKTIKENPESYPDYMNWLRKFEHKNELSKI